MLSILEVLGPATGQDLILVMPMINSVPKDFSVQVYTFSM